MKRAIPSWLGLLLVLPLIVLTGCDSNGNGGNGGNGAAENEAPTASFTASTSGLTADVDASASSDPDGEITSYEWSFADEDTETGETSTHTFSGDGTFDITLTVRDDDGATDDTTASVMVADDVVTLTDDITSDRTLSADTTYMVNGLLFVGESTADGVPPRSESPTLTIEPGTVLKFMTSQNVTAEGATQQEGASALIVRRSGRIMANGEEDNPIIMTSELDDLNDPSDLLTGTFQPQRTLWGGVVILGRSTNNQANPTDNQIEGIPQDNNSALWGGSSPGDDSGEFSYVSIRHAGFSISGVPGDEINGLTMGSVGEGTDIHHVEVFANFDDGFEWFGGTVNTHHLAAVFVGDDAFDYDAGYRGSNYQWFAIHTNDRAGRGGEHDGVDSGTSPNFVSSPVVSNATYIGAGEDAGGIGGDSNDRTFAIRDQAGGEYYNSIFTEYPGQGVNIATDGTESEFNDGKIVFENNAFFAYGDLTGDEEAQFSNDAVAAFQAISGEVSGLSDDLANGFDNASSSYGGNLIADPELGSTDRLPQAAGGANAGPLNPVPNATDLPQTTAPSDMQSQNSEVNAGSEIPDLGFHGAFDPSANGLWIDGWTALSDEGYLDN